MKELLFIIIIILYNSCNNSYMIFNLQTFINNSNNYDNGINFIYSIQYSLYYTELLFGTPRSKYIMQVNLDDYDFKISNYNCEIEIQDKSTEKLFDPFLSNSSLVEISGINFTYYGVNEIYKITDHIKILSNNNNYIYPTIQFIYNPRNLSISKRSKDYSPYTCFKLGLRLPEKDYNFYEDFEISLLGQFKRKNIINSYEWFIDYNSDNKDTKLIIGTSPHEYNNKKYNENNSKKIEGYFRENTYNYYNYWNLVFTQIYMKNKDNKREFLDKRAACLVPSLNVIKGTYEYQKIINDTIFSELIKNHKCFEEYDLENDVFYCDNDVEIKNYIKNNFLNLIFFNAIIEEEFILTYNDLFVEKGNKIFFLVVFDYSKSLITWIIGKPFLKKYFFSYNYDMKIMTYYKNNTSVKEDNFSNNKNDNWELIIIIICLIIICCIIGFLMAKHFYNYKKKNKAQELDDDYQYKNNETINNIEAIVN